MRQTDRNFVKKLDFLTSPGYLNGPSGREDAGLPANTGPYRVISQLGIYGFDEVTKKMTLLQLFEGYTVTDIQELSSFPIEVAYDWTYVTLPTEQELETFLTFVPARGVLGKRHE